MTTQKRFFYKNLKIYQHPPIPGQQWIAVASMNNYNADTKENAALFVAAPELLEACKAASAVLKSEGINENSAIGGIQIKMIDEAIKKAEKV